MDLNIVNTDLATISPLQLPLFLKKGIRADVLRLDKIHPVISGNKWFKLAGYLQHAIDQQCSTLLTFGGAYSNHIVATACAAQAAGFASVGIIRGEEADRSSPTLADARSFGMQLEFISRADYRQKQDPAFLEQLLKKHPGACMIPEGGAGPPGIRGSGAMLQLFHPNEYSHLYCAVGTGTTFLGLAGAAGPVTAVEGICVLKAAEGLSGELMKRIKEQGTGPGCRLHQQYHFGGYARKNTELFRFMNQFYEETGIPTDFVYTAKLFYSVIDLAEKEKIAPGSHLLIIHSGGLQGNRSLPPGTLLF